MDQIPFRVALWLVRAGRHGEQEQEALAKGIVTIAFNDLPDLSTIREKSELERLYFQVYPNAKKMRAANLVGQVWSFLREIKLGDIVALPLKSQSAIALGRIEGDYEYSEIAPEIKHHRKVGWIRTIPRSEFDQDLLYSLGAFMTVCRIQRNDAENRIWGLMERKSTGDTVTVVAPPSIEEVQDIEEQSRDQIVKFIAAKFSGHNLARLVDAILKAQGYITKVSEPGRDGGVDILAGSGAFGFEDPRVCVQVKSSPNPVDTGILRELQGVAGKRGAKQALLVAWGGFNKEVIREAANDFFTVRLMDQGDLLDELAKHYEKFDDEIKAELPLKRIWALVEEEE